MQAFSCKTKIISGPGSISALEELKAKRLLLVADPYFAKTDLPARIQKAAGAMETFFEVQPDPTAELAARGTAVVQAFRPDTVVALGGGSAMDCAKAMVYFSGLKVTFVAIPTTSGSGSEVTDFAILTHNGVKHPLVDPRLRPKMAILEGALLEELPPGLIADSGFDVLSHALEACCAKNRSSFTDALAREVFVNQAGNIYHFYLRGEEDLEKLLSIFVLTGPNREDQALEDDRFVLYRGDGILYAAKLESAAYALAMNHEEIINRFHLIHHDWKTGET